MRSEQINELAGALAKAQGAMENATMNKTNPHFKSKYADLASVLDAVRKPLGDNGLSITQQTVINGDGLILRTTLWHSSGQWIASEYPLPTGTPQVMGSARTYARRYEITSLVCNSADEDDDANQAQQAASKAPARPSEPNRMPGISQSQLQNLTAMIENLGGTTLQDFLSVANISELKYLTPDRWQGAVDWLNRRKQRMAQEAQEGLDDENTGTATENS